MSVFNESAVRRAGDGKFAEKPAAAEAGGVTLAERPDYAPFDAVESRYDQVAHDDLEGAARSAQEVADAGYIGVVHAERHYSSDGVADGEIDYSSESYEVRAFESEAQMLKWSNESGMAAQEGRGDIHASLDAYPHPYDDDTEVHEAYLHLPQTPAVDRVPQTPMPVGALVVGDHVLHEGRAQKVYSVGDEDDHVAVELEDEIIYPDADEKLTRLDLPSAA